MVRPEESTSIVQLKIRLLGISPMIWRRVLMPAAVSLRELHGIGEYKKPGAIADSCG